MSLSRFGVEGSDLQAQVFREKPCKISWPAADPGIATPNLLVIVLTYLFTISIGGW